jgi:hypothetical protein
MRSFASGEAGWHMLLLFYSNESFAFDGITSVLRLHLQEPWPKRNLGEGPEAAALVDAGAYQQLLCAISVILISYYEIILHDLQHSMLRYNLIQVHFKVSSIKCILIRINANRIVSSVAIV